MDEALEHLRQVQLADRGQLERNAPEDGGVGAALDEDVAPESSDSGQSVTDVDRLVGLQALALRGRQDREEHLLEVLGLEGVRVQGDQAALDAEERRSHGLQVEVRGLLLGHELEQLRKRQCSRIITA